MKKLFTLLTVAIVAFVMTGCRPWEERLENLEDRVSALEDVVEKTNDDIAALQTIVNALQNNVYVLSVETTNDGYTINFSDGTSATISNGKDGANGQNGVNAPIISVKQDTDGNYYWTLDGEWLIIDGQRVRANGIDGINGTNGQNGQDGQDAIAPQVRINEDTKEWEISVDGGITWEPTGVIAEGKDGENGSIIVEGETLFQSIDTSNEDYVLLVLADGTELKLPYYDETAPLFIIVDAPELAQMEYGTTVEFSVEAENVFEHLINVPEGWHASYNGSVLSVTAPAKDLCHFDKEGTIAVTVVSAEGKMAIVKLNVMAGEWVEIPTTVLRTLTFEDEDYKGSEGNTYWSEKIPDGAYGNGLYYTEWFDEGNTELAYYKNTSALFPGYGGQGGISNYVGDDWENDGNYMNDLQAYNVTGGHSGTNFNVHFGYLDDSGMGMMNELVYFEFGDSEARIIDHMWVTNTTYVYNQLQKVSGFGNDYVLSDNSTFKIVAYGYESWDDEEPTTAEFYLLNTGKNFVTEWTKWDLSALGKVVKVEFNLIGSDDMYGDYGLVVPGYFAYDDVAVQFPGESEIVFE